MVEKLATVLPVEDMQAAVAAWSALLGAQPTFVDGDRWAQFDVAGSRLALAGTDRTSNAAGVMVKVADLDGVHAKLTEAGFAPGSVETGPHERRFAVTMPGGWTATLYQPL